MRIEAVRTEGLGDASFVVVHGRIAVIVDPQRDIDRFLDVLERLDAEPRYVVETHLHNDYVSGGLDLARTTGAELVMPAGAGAAFRHTPAFHGEVLDTGPFELRPLHTPGHTPEHVSYVVVVDGRDHAVFTGGSLLVGSAGRTDLLGMDRAHSLARLQHGSVNRIAALDGSVLLMPTHGEGSFCTSSGVGGITSTVDRERTTNPVLQIPDAEAFAEDQLTGLGPYPSYYALMGPINLAGPPPIEAAPPPVLTVEQIPAGATVIDVRPVTEFAKGHLPGAIGVEMSDQVGVWTGWLKPPGTRLVIVAGPDQDTELAVRQLRRIGFDHIAGVVTDLAPAGGTLLRHQIATVEQLVGAWRDEPTIRVLDVRPDDEVAGRSLPGAVNVHVPEMVADPDRLGPPGDVWVVCASGFRASIVAGPLRDAGHRPTVVVGGGMPEILDRLEEEHST